MVTGPPPALVASFGVGLAAAGYGAVRYYGRGLADPYEGRTTGTVLSASLSGDGSDAGGEYVPEVRYEYEVDGVSYENDRLRAGGSALSRRGARVVLGEYEAGSSVVVRYDPDSPDRSVLVSPGRGRVWTALVAAGLLVAGASVWLWLWS